MSEQPVHYHLLRDLEGWDESAVLLDLEKRLDGALGLARNSSGALHQSGTLTAGPFDAGRGCLWQRAHVAVELPSQPGARCELHIFTSNAVSAAPEWEDPASRAKALDTLVKPGRYLWLQVTLVADDQHQAGPLLQQAQLETVAESYLQHLPAVYAREDGEDGFLERWLALFRAELGDLELAQQQMAGRFDPRTAPENGLRWLASWLAFEPPERLGTAALRRLLLRVHEINDWRATPLGMSEMIELYCGARPVIQEAFRARHIWQLGYNSRLGFDTGLAAALPDGMIVSGHTLADPQLMGLRGEYYQGVNFHKKVLSRLDPQVDFHWGIDSPDALIPANNFSVRWSGQLQVPGPTAAAGAPVSSSPGGKNFHFFVFAYGGVRLWVDGQLLIDQWNFQGVKEHKNFIRLTKGSKYDIKLEYHTGSGPSIVKLLWSGGTQPREIIHADFTGEYYRGTDLSGDWLVTYQDPAIDFDWGNNSPHAVVPNDYFSVRWSGQFSPRFSEKYTFYVKSDDGARLYVDGLLIIDHWDDHAAREYSSALTPLALDAGHWYAIELEYYEKGGFASAQLSWSSRSQPKEVIRRARLYAVRAASAQLELSALESQAGDILIGQSVVGESGPLEKSDFGMPLYSDTAHLFSISVPACALPKVAQREMLRRIIELEKPAHTDYQLCFVEPRMRVGYQARLGIDSIVAAAPAETKPGKEAH